MAENQRQHGENEQSIEAASSSEPPARSSASTSAPPPQQESSIPPQAVSPFQTLVGPDDPAPEADEEKEGPVFPVVEKRPSLNPKPSNSPVLIMPIRQVSGNSSTPPAPAIPLSNAPAPPPEKEPPVEAADAAFAVAGERHDDEQIFDLSDEMVVEPSATKASTEGISISNPPAPPINGGLPTNSKPPVELSLPSVSGPPPPPKTSPSVEPPTTQTGAASDEDLDNRETLFSSSSLKGRDGDDTVLSASEISSDQEPEAGLFVDVAGSLDTASAEEEEIPVEVEAPDSEGADTSDAGELDDAEELDLEDAEVMPSGPPAVPTVAKDGRKPAIRRRRKQSKEWWARIFNDDYVSTIPKATVKGDQRKVNFIEKSLALNSNALVLDLACGNGRHSVGMAKRGYRVVGIDLSLPMLAQAAELAQDERQNINFIHGDMRDLSFDKTFDAIFCMGTSFGYFEDDVNLKVLQGVFRALKPGGSFLLEVANRDHVVGHAPELTWFEGNGSICMEETAFNHRTSRILVTRQLIMDGGRQVQNDISIRLYSLHELERMLMKNGFELGMVSGHTATPGAFFGPHSVRIFICAKRPR